MSDYVKSTNFAVKDGLTTGDPAKKVKGTEIDVEFNAIASAITSKADANSPTFTGTPVAPTASPGTNTTQIATTAFVTAADTAATSAAITAERSATATLTNKTLTSPTITSPSVSGLYLSDSSIVFEGSTNDTYETTLTVTDPTADRTLTLPNVTGTIVTTGDTGSVSQAMIATNVVGKGPVFSAYMTNGSANQSISANTWTKAKLDTEEFDTNNNFDSTTNYRFTPTVAGYYQINGAVWVNATTTNPGNVRVAIYKNGSLYKQSYVYGNNSTIAGLNVSAVVYLNGSTDYVELYGIGSSGSGLYFAFGKEYTYMSGVLVSAA